MIAPFKGRQVDHSAPVWVYRNLSNRGAAYSIMQRGLVVGHADDVIVTDCTLKVRPGGRDRVRRTGVKNVHAFVVGKLSRQNILAYPWRNWVEAHYNPRQYDGFVIWCSETARSKIITEAKAVSLGRKFLVLEPR